MSIAAIRRGTAGWLRYLIALAAHYSGADALYRQLTGPGLVILMLHRLRDESDPWPLSMSVASFGRIVAWLRDRDALTSLDEGLRSLSGQAHPGVGYAITFDDGYRDNLRLVDGGFGKVPAVVYVATGHVDGEPIWLYRMQHAVEARTRDRLDLGSLGLGLFDLFRSFDRQRLYLLLPPRLKQLDPGRLARCIDDIIDQTRPGPITGDARAMLDWQEIRALDESGVRIGAHTRNHVLLARADDATARDEVLGSQSDIAAAIAVPPRHFAYPNGGASDFGQRDVDTVRDAGFETAVTSIEGTNRRSFDRYRLLRYNVHEKRYRAPPGHLSKALFFSETSGLLGWLRALQAA